MGCYLGIVVIEENGDVWHAGRGWYWEEFSGPQAVRDLVSLTWKMGTFPVDNRTFEPACCNAWLVDCQRKIARTYSCQHDKAISAEARLRNVWRGWDLKVAHDRSVELSELIGFPVEQPDVIDELSCWTNAKDAGLVTLNTHELDVEYEWNPALVKATFHRPSYDTVLFTITLIDVDGLVRDYAFYGDIAFYAGLREGKASLQSVVSAMGFGTRLIDELKAAPPSYDFMVYEPQEALLIDERTRELHFTLGNPRLGDGLGNKIYQIIKERWPGFRVVHQPNGYSEFLALSGRKLEGNIPVEIGLKGLKYIKLELR